MSVQDAKQYHTDQVHYLWADVTFESGTVSLGWIPPGAAVIGGAAVVTTAFDSGTSDLVDIGFRNAGDGTADDTDEFATDLDVSSVGAKALDEIATAGNLYFPEGAEIVAVYASAGTAPTAGAARAYVTYVVDNT